MSAFYTVAYRIGFTPWEALLDHPPFANALLGLVAQAEAGQPPYGKALDIGTGSGTWGVQLARRGWDVTGVDIIPKALKRADQRATEAGVPIRLVECDITRMGTAEVGNGYQLLLDTGTFHGLTQSERAAMGRSVSAVASPDATLLIDAFAPGHRGPLPRGCTREAIEAAFPNWRITDVVPADTEPDLIARVLRFDEHFYRLVYVV